MMQINVNGQVFQREKPVENWDLVQIGPRQWHVLYEGKSYTLQLLSINKEEKSMQLQLNGMNYQIGIRDKFDMLLQQMGMTSANSQKMKQLKAPMPGLVVKLLVKEGDSFQKGDSLLILEAMKMENMIKAAGDGKVKRIAVSERAAVEKNQLLLEME